MAEADASVICSECGETPCSGDDLRAALVQVPGQQQQGRETP